MNNKKRLLDKYSIPIEHLDFDYIKKCSDVRKLEQMLEILKSNEEGYYPELTKFAENKLNELDPDNRMLRTEVKCLYTGIGEKQEINEFVRSIKVKDRKIRDGSNTDNSINNTFPPIRKLSNSSDSIDAIGKLKSLNNNSKRIASSDYKQWDKYDADTECLKMDLHEEQIREKALIEQKRQNKTTLIEVLSEQETVENISDVEKQELAEKHRIKGNEFFKCSEFQYAIAEYTRSLNYNPTAAVYNNRAVSHLKLKMYIEAIRDCDECLKRESTNIKAMLRKCDALMATDCKNQAYTLYSEVLKYDPDNVIAKKATKDISIRLKIQDVTSQPKKNERIFLEIADNQEDENDFYRKFIVT